MKDIIQRQDQMLQDLDEEYIQRVTRVLAQRQNMYVPLDIALQDALVELQGEEPTYSFLPDLGNFLDLLF